jgi:hypothetical protein
LTADNKERIENEGKGRMQTLKPKPNQTVERIKDYLERIPEGAQDAWIRAAYEVYLEKRLDSQRVNNK